jgi:hypothetical protein
MYSEERLKETLRAYGNGLIAFDSESDYGNEFLIIPSDYFFPFIWLLESFLESEEDRMSVHGRKFEIPRGFNSSGRTLSAAVHISFRRGLDGGLKITTYESVPGESVFQPPVMYVPKENIAGFLEVILLAQIVDDGISYLEAEEPDLEGKMKVHSLYFDPKES